jgi:hypothetical protein
MSCFKIGSAMGMGLIVVLLISGCRGDGDYGDYDGPGGGGGGGSGSASEACQQSCDCPSMSILPDCESICLQGLNMISDKQGCIDCMLDASCSEYEGGECNSVCGGY